MSEHSESFGIDSFIPDKYFDPDNPALYLHDMKHWNPSGHRVVAEALTDRLSVILRQLDTENE